MSDEDKKTIKALLDGMIIKHQAQQMVSNLVIKRKIISHQESKGMCFIKQQIITSFHSSCSAGC